MSGGTEPKSKGVKSTLGSCFNFDASLEKYLKENIWHPSQVFKKARDGSLLLTMEVGGLVEVMSWLPLKRNMTTSSRLFLRPSPN